jgi:effector-binding domain-containing protein
MKVVKVILTLVLVLIALVGVLGLIAPKKYQVERSVSIDAPAAVVFRHVQYWKNWKDWSPWAAMDTTMSTTIEGKDGEAGSVYKWTGKKTGVGQMTATAVTLPTALEYQLRFIKPYSMTSDGYVRLSEEQGKTKAAWAMLGKSPFPMNVLNLFVSMNKMVGKDFEKGLVKLKDLCEKEMAAASKYEVKVVNFPARQYVGIQKELTMDQISAFFPESVMKIMGILGSKGIRMAGAPCGIYYSWNEGTMSTDMAAAIPVFGKQVLEGLTSISLPAAKSYVIDYYGPYDQSMGAYTAFDVYFAKNNLKMKLPMIEEYLTDMQKEKDPAKWLTRIYCFAE